MPGSSRSTAGTRALRLSATNRKAHPDNWTETGLDALSKDMEKSTANMLYDLGCSLSVVGSCLSIVWLPINALVVLT